QQLQALKDLWFYYAGIYNGLPLDDRTALEQVLAERPRPGRERNRYTYFPDCADVPEEAGVPINGRSFTIVAGVEIESPDAHGVLFATGGTIGGHSLYMKDRRLHYVYNWIGTHLQDVVADRDITTGRHALTAEFALQGESDDSAMPGFSGTLTLYIDDDVVGSGKIVTQPGAFCLVGDGICVGRDSASPVTPDYKPPFPFTGGQIDKVVVDVSGEHYVDHEAQVRAWLMRD
ncbi:MAG TPA: arylsulfatase, partial [Acidimicrobiales bacterium]